MIILLTDAFEGYEIGIEYIDTSIDLVQNSPQLDYSSLQQISDTTLCETQFINFPSGN